VFRSHPPAQCERWASYGFRVLKAMPPIRFNHAALVSGGEPSATHAACSRGER
jgi:hypothetical protein